MHLKQYIIIIIILKVKALRHTEKMKDALLRGSWLNDEHITLALNILRLQFPSIDGFQSLLLAQTGGFALVCLSRAVQIHHIYRNHWRASFSAGSEVALCDSSYSGGGLSSSLTHQLASIYKCFITKV